MEGAPVRDVGVEVKDVSEALVLDVKFITDGVNRILWKIGFVAKVAVRVVVFCFVNLLVVYAE